jgi:hypothetical protein
VTTIDEIGRPSWTRLPRLLPGRQLAAATFDPKSGHVRISPWVVEHLGRPARIRVLVDPQRRRFAIAEGAAAADDSRALYIEPKKARFSARGLGEALLLSSRLPSRFDATPHGRTVVFSLKDGAP